MRYIGNKENILDQIYSIMQKHGVKGNTFFDFFSGTSSVARYFKKLGYQIYSCDVMYLSYCLQKAYIENNLDPLFEGLESHIPKEVKDCLFFASPLDKVLAYLNTIDPIEGFIYNHYTPEGTSYLDCPRMYFSSENGRKIDAIRTKIEEWKDEHLLTDSEYFILLSCLIETVSFYANISGVYAAFHKKWDPRALKPLVLRSIKTINNGKNNTVYHGNSLDIASNIDVDILYLDPPYNARQYLPNYHLVETIAQYDNPSIRGVTGMREYEGKKSSFCNAKTALKDLDHIAQEASFKYLVLSYSSEGIMSQKDIITTLSRHGNTYFEEFEYLRFKSNNNGLSRTKKNIFEQIYILKK